MAITREQGFKRLQAAGELAKATLAKFAVGSDVGREAFSQGAEILPETTPETRREVLRALGVVSTSRGYGGPATICANASENSKRVLQTAEALWEKLSVDGRLTQQVVADIAAEKKLDDSRPAVNLLKRIELAVGIQRAGGLRTLDVAEKEVKAAEEEEVAKPTPPGKAKESEDVIREKVYYELFAQVVADWPGDYEAIVVGGHQVFSGEWSTPDIVGISVERAPALVLPIVRVATVEVKLQLSRFAIAEAAAHSRFAHYAYVGVMQAPSQMDGALITELAQAGLGLICPLRANALTLHVYLDAPFRRPDEEDLEALLSQCRSANGQPMAELVRTRVRRAIGVLFEG